MKKIKIFLASSNELVEEREKFEIEVNRKNKLLHDKGYFLHLEIWEDLSDKVSQTRSQDEYNKKIKESDLFCLLAWNKVGIYTAEEFETAFGSFRTTNKPFIFTYFKNNPLKQENSLNTFKSKLKSLQHFYAPYDDFNDLWNQFNKELDWLLADDFKEFNPAVHEKERVNYSNSTHINNNYGNVFINYGDKKIPKILGSIPVNPPIFIGRDSILERVRNSLYSSDTATLLVNGEGGIGKTTVASRLFHSLLDEFTHLIWIVGDKSFKDSFLEIAKKLGIQFSNESEDERVEILVATLLELNNTLLIIDNLDNKEELENSQNILNRLSKLKILITSRVNEPEHFKELKIGHLEENEAIDLFKEYYTAYKEEEKEILQGVLKAINYNTLVIELLAKNLQNFTNLFKREYTLEELLKDLNNKGVLFLSKTKDLKTDYQNIKEAKPEKIVEAMFDLSQLNEDEIRVLTILSALPNTPIAFEDLEPLLPSEEQLAETLTYLFQKGWIDVDKEQLNFKTNPIIKEVVLKRAGEALYNSLEEIIYSLTEQLSYELGTGHINLEYLTILKYISFSESLLSCVQSNEHNLGVLYERVGNFFRAYGDLTKAKEYYEKLLKLRLELYESNPDKVIVKNALAVSYERIGSISVNLGERTKAKGYYEKETALFKELYESNQNNVTFKNGLASSYEKVGSIYADIGVPIKAREYFEKNLKLREELYKSNQNNLTFKNSLAISFGKLGNIYMTLENQIQAKELYEKAIVLFEELYKSNPENVRYKNDISIAFDKLGFTYMILGNLTKAKEYFEKGLKLTKELYDSNCENVKFKNGLAISYYNLGNCFKNKEDLKEAKKECEKAKSLWFELKESFPTYPEFSKNYDFICAYLKELE